MSQFQPPPMGLANLQMRARQGDPQAIAMLQEILGGQQGGGPGGPGGAPGGPPGAGGPPMGGPGGPSPGAGPGGPAPGGPGGGPPQMTQSQFGNGGPVPADVQARRAQQLIQLLRARDGHE